MKVLIVCNIDSYQNPYVRTLSNGLIRHGVDVTCSILEFWNNATTYDIIHIMWPNLLVKKNDAGCCVLKSKIEAIKSAGKILMSTCHNIKPHYNNDIAINNAYRLVYEASDYIHHLGIASISLLLEAYPNIKAESVVIPHHTYDNLYDFNVSKYDARAKLKIPQNAKVIMSFGSFRDDEERELILNLSNKLGNRYYFLTPGFYRDRLFRKNIFKGVLALYNTIKYTIMAQKHNLHICHSYVSDDFLPYYLVAADVMLIQRVKILNSGNVPLAMLAGLPIVGPNDGNVENILRETGNYVFDKKSPQDIGKYLDLAINDRTLGLKNISYAKSHLSTDKISEELANLYVSILSNQHM